VQQRVERVERQLPLIVGPGRWGMVGQDFVCLPEEDIRLILEVRLAVAPIMQSLLRHSLLCETRRSDNTDAKRNDLFHISTCRILKDSLFSSCSKEFVKITVSCLFAEPVRMGGEYQKLCVSEDKGQAELIYRHYCNKLNFTI
jgi:hypothetical protein